MTLQTLAIVGCALAVAGMAAMAAAFFRIARSVSDLAESLNASARRLENKVDEGLENLRDSIVDVREITGQARAQMGRVDSILQNVDQFTGDAKSSMGMIDRTVSPILANLHGVLAGVRKGMETWREMARDDEAAERRRDGAGIDE